MTRPADVTLILEGTYPYVAGGVSTWVHQILGAYPGAYERLAGAGLTPWRVALCGPAIAIGREPGGPAFVPAAEWELVDLGDRIGITALRPRATSFIRTPIAVRGTIVDGGIVPASP